MWSYRIGLSTIFIGTAFHLLFVVIFRFTAPQAVPLFTLLITVCSSFLCIIQGAYLVCKRYSPNTIQTSIERSQRLGTCVASAIGMVVISSFWGILQYLSQRFSNDQTTPTEQLAVVIAFPIVYVVAEQVSYSSLFIRLHPLPLPLHRL